MLQLHFGNLVIRTVVANYAYSKADALIIYLQKALSELLKNHTSLQTQSRSVGVLSSLLDDPRCLWVALLKTRVTLKR